MTKPFTYFATVLKAGEGGPGAAGIVRALKRAGIRARATRSPYVGHLEVEVEEGRLTAAQKVVKL